MKIPLLPLAAAAFAVLAAGCNTIEPSATIAARIQEKSETFARMTPRAQQAVQSGAIERGFTNEMVYMALGQPATVRTKEATLGKLEMWTYHVFSRSAPYAQNSINHPGARTYTPMLTATNSAPVRTTIKEVQPIGFGFGAYSSLNPLDVPDMIHEKLYVFFANGRVAEIKYDSSGS